MPLYFYACCPPAATPPADRRSSDIYRTTSGPSSDHPRTIPGPRAIKQLFFKQLHTHNNAPRHIRTQDADNLHHTATPRFITLQQLIPPKGTRLSSKMPPARIVPPPPNRCVHRATIVSKAALSTTDQRLTPRTANRATRPLQHTLTINGDISMSEKVRTFAK